MPIAVVATTDSLTIDRDGAQSFLAIIPPCSGASNAVTYDATAKSFGCNSLAGGPGGTNTASNLGGGLDNYSTTVGSDLQFNSFSSADFDLGSNLITIDHSKWATLTDVAAATSGLSLPPYVHVAATADLAGNHANLEGADIAAAISACTAGHPCQIDLEVGTYTDVCLEVSRDHTHIIGRGEGTQGSAGTGKTILKPYADYDSCSATERGAMITFRAVDDVELAYVEMDGEKGTKGAYCTSPGVPTGCTGTCDTNFCGKAIEEYDSGGGSSTLGWFHHIYMHDFVSIGLETGHARDWLLEYSTFEHFGCNQTGSNSCGCTGDPIACRGWTAATDINGLGTRQGGNAANDMSFFGDTRNSIVRYSTFGIATHGGIEVSGDCINFPDTNCPDNNELSDNIVTYSVISNGGTHTRIVRNNIANQGLAGGTGDTGTGVIITDQSHNHILVADNFIHDNSGSGIEIKTSGPGDITVRGNTLKDNCVDHTLGGDIEIRANDSGSGYPNDLLIANNLVTGASNCTYGLKDAIDASRFGGSVQYIGGSYDTGSTAAVRIDTPNLFVQGLQANGDLTFGAGATGFAQGLTVSGALTNTGGVCLEEDDNTPIPDSCVGDGVDGGGGGGGSISDGAYPSGWDTDTTTGPSRNAMYDYLHLFDTDDDGLVNKLDQTAGICNTNGSGVIQSPIVPGTGVATALAVNVGTAGSFVVNGGALGTPASGNLSNGTSYPIAQLTGAGTGVLAALAVNTGSAGAPVLFNGALGTPSSGTATNLSGTALSLTVGNANQLTTNPSDCSAHQFATTIAQNGNLTCAQPAIGSDISGLGTGVASALANNTPGSGAVVVNGAALGTPSSGVATNLTGYLISALSGAGTGVLTALSNAAGSASGFLRGSDAAKITLSAADASGNCTITDLWIRTATATGIWACTSTNVWTKVANGP